MLRSRLDIGYGEGQEGREVTPGLLALAPRPMAVPLRCGILDKDQVWGRGWRGEEFEMPLKCQVSDMCIWKSE